MAVEDDFQEDPTMPSIAQLAATKTEIIIPWQQKAIDLGMGLLLSKNPTSSSPLPTAFVQTSTNIQFVAEDGCEATYKETSSSDAGGSSEHLSATMGASIGGSWLGGSVAGKYDKAVMNNTDVQKASVQASIRVGTIMFTECPRLNLEALSKVPRPRLGKQDSTFLDTYGDYYIAGMCVGATSSIFMSSSGSESSNSENTDVNVTGKLLGFSKTKNYDWNEREAKAISEVSISAFDTLDAVHIDAPASVSGIYISEQRKRAAELAAMGRKLESRLRKRAQQYDICNDKSLSTEQCRQICESGLVIGLILFPFAQLRDYANVSNSVI